LDLGFMRLEGFLEHLRTLGNEALEQHKELPCPSTMGVILQ